MKKRGKKETPKRDFLWLVLRVSFLGVVILVLVNFLIEILASNLRAYAYYDYKESVISPLFWFSIFSILFSMASLMKRKLVRVIDWLFPAIVIISSIIVIIFILIWGLTHGVAQ